MEEITLQGLLEAGCHFGHKAERWHPKASRFIFAKKDGIHIIDLVKTKTGLEAAAAFVRDLAAAGKEVIFVGTKRQAAGIVKQEATAVSAPYFVERWIGGFLTNWNEIRRNIDKILKMEADRASGAWKKFPKHEQVKMGRYLDRIKVYYGGVLSIKEIPAALIIIDIKKEEPVVREGMRMTVPIVGVVDTNADPTPIDWVIPANDDAVGSIQYIIHALAAAYGEGKAQWEKSQQEANARVEAAKVAAAAPIVAAVAPEKSKAVESKKEEVKKPQKAKTTQTK